MLFGLGAVAHADLMGRGLYVAIRDQLLGMEGMMRIRVIDLVAKALGITVWIGEVRYGKRPHFECDPED